ncbi:hypothetical protein EON65_13890 [archaeon]|nr:MAG: hypothetical protein EON65_13890 [archaeon]
MGVVPIPLLIPILHIVHPDGHVAAPYSAHPVVPISCQHSRPVWCMVYGIWYVAGGLTLSIHISVHFGVHSLDVRVGMEARVGAGIGDRVFGVTHVAVYGDPSPYTHHTLTLYQRQQ